MMDAAFMMISVALVIAIANIIALTIRNDRLQQFNEWMHDHMTDTSETCFRINEEYEHLYDRHLKLIGEYSELMDWYQDACATLRENGLLPEDDE